MMSLSINQEKVLQIIKDFCQKNNESPSLIELQHELINNGIKAKSKRSVTQYLETLVKKGYITRNSNHKSIKINSSLNSAIDLISIPILGTTNAGAPLALAEENVQGILKISSKLLNKVQNIFALQVSGDSMNKTKIDNKYIEDNDYVIIDKTTTDIKNNDIVLAIVAGSATIKKFKKTLFGEIILLPESSNPIHQPIYIHESDSFFINGKVINVLKSAKNI